MKKKGSMLLLAVFGWASSLAGDSAVDLSPTAAVEETQFRLPQEVVVRAKRSALLAGQDAAARSLDKVPGGVGLVATEEVKQGRTATLQDVLQLQPGVFTQSRFGAEDARLSIRGSGIERTQVLRGINLFQDGIPLSRADGNGDFQMLEPLALDYTEVYRGANAGRFGVASLGGAINFVSHSGLESPGSQVRAEAGSFHYLRGQVSTADSSDAFDHYASATHYSQDGFRDHAKQDSQRFNGNWGWRTPSTELRLFSFWQESASQEPGGLTADQMRQNPRQANPQSAAGGDGRNLRTARLAAESSLALGPGLFQVTGYYVWKELNYPQAIVLDQATQDWGGEVAYRGEGRISGCRNLLNAGVGGSNGSLDDLRYANLGDGRRGDKNTDLYRQADNWQMFLEEQLSLPENLAWVAGFTAGESVRNQKDRLAVDGDHSFACDYRSFNPRAGLRWELSPRSQLFANLSRSFEPPTFKEFTPLGVSLDPQRATTAEAGTRGQEGWLRWEAVYYRAWLSREFMALSVAPRMPAVTINAGDTLHEGIESGATLTLWSGPPRGGATDRLELQAAFDWNNFILVNDPTYGSNRIPGIPARYGRGALSFRQASGFYIGPTFEWNLTAYPVDLANTLSADPYLIMGARLGFQARHGFSWFLEARNLGDLAYAATTGVTDRLYPDGSNSALFFPGDGRSYYAGLEWKQ